MPIYPIPPERPGGHCRELHSPLGFGPRGNSVFFCQSYTDNGNDTYTAPKSSFVSTRDSGMYDPRTGDLVLFRVEHDDDSSLLIGYIFSINPIGGAITFVKLAEISMSGMSAADRAKLDGIATAANRVTATEVAHYPGATSIRLGIINANDLVASNYYVPKADSDGRIEQDAIVDGSITTAKLASKAVTNAKLADEAVTGDKMAEGTIQETNISQGFLASLVYNNALMAAGSVYLFPKFAAASVQAAQAMAVMGITTTQLLPSEISMETPILQDVRFRLAWLSGTELDSGNVFYSANLGTSAVTLFAKGRISQCTGVMGVDNSWTITPLPTSGDEVSY